MQETQVYYGRKTLVEFVDGKNLQTLECQPFYIFLERNGLNNNNNIIFFNQSHQAKNYKTAQF